MNPNENEKLLTITLELRKHPLIEFLQRVDTELIIKKGGHTFKVSNNTNFDKIIQKLKSYSYKTKEEWQSEMKSLIYPHWELENLTEFEVSLCQKLNREINHIFEKLTISVGLYSSSKWGKSVFNLQDSLQCQIADSPKVFQLPYRQIVRKPKVTTYSIKTLEEIVHVINELPKEELPQIFSIIKKNEKDITINEKGENEIEISKLSVSTIEEIRKYLKSYLKKHRHNS